MTDLLGRVIRMNRLGDHVLAEPYAGGAGASLSLLYLEKAAAVAINDADPAMHAFWWAVTHRIDAFVKAVEETPISIEEWTRQREVYRRGRRESRMRLGFATFYLNRCNRSGIIADGGPIGGLAQAGTWTLSARFNKPELIRRLRRVAEYSSRVDVTGLDGIDFIASRNPDQTFFFIDPPYYHKGETLYLNSLDEQYHQRLARELHSRIDESWVLTYDDCPEIRALYAGWAAIRPFSLRYVASERRQGKELLITPPSLALPEEQNSAAVGW